MVYYDRCERRIYRPLRRRRPAQTPAEPRRRTEGDPAEVENRKD